MRPLESYPSYREVQAKKAQDEAIKAAYADRAAWRPSVSAKVEDGMQNVASFTFKYSAPMTPPSGGWVNNSGRPVPLAGEMPARPSGKLVLKLPMHLHAPIEESKPVPKANAEEWIEHAGGGMPIDGFKLVVVRLRDGSVECARRASFWSCHPGEKPTSKNCNWTHADHRNDIVAYRIVDAA